ncbi:MAG: hypothetical protein IAG13_29990, partial [Deltaproteobacteria bacterium]|nr:hypothetical protein [Nannocystaceae bacterium]
RYGSHAGDGLADQCVPLDVADGSGESTLGTGVEASSASGDDSSDAATGFTSSPPPDPVCGNGAAERGEACDGGDLSGSSCFDLGHDSGTLGCLDDCSFDVSGCGDCGNAVVDGDELCDGAPPPEQSCAGFGWFAGTLACARDCNGIDESGCTNCGNAVVDPGELCDGPMLGISCAELGFVEQGEVPSCADDCNVDTSGCGMPVCGVDATQPLVDCPPTCSSCENGECLFDCTGTSECDDLAIVCPAGWPCRVVCSGSSACNGASVVCPEFFACEVACDGSSACSDLALGCSVTGRCSMSCDVGSSSVCDDATVDCGGDVCNVACADGEPSFDCGPSCECVACTDAN